jgi:hypothetical protein
LKQVKEIYDRYYFMVDGENSLDDIREDMAVKKIFNFFKKELNISKLKASNEI